MDTFPIELPMCRSALKALDLSGPQDVADQLLDLIRSVEECRGTNEDHLAVIRDVHASLKETRSRAILWASGDPEYCSSLNPDTFHDLAVTELFGLTDHIPIGPDRLLEDILYEAKEPWFPGFDTWNLNTLQAALDLLREARDKITGEREITID
jgi:hypothetical protein